MVNYLKTHLFYVILIVVGIIAFRAWLYEHDNKNAQQAAKQVAEAQVKADVATIKTLTDSLASIKIAAAKQVVVIQKEAAAIKTPQQAIPVVDAFDPALRPRLLPDMTIAVDSVTLAKDLEACRIDRVQLGACQGQLALYERPVDGILAKQNDIIAQKDKELKAAKPSFWSQLKRDSKTAFIGALIAEGIHILAKGAL